MKNPSRKSWLFLTGAALLTTVLAACSPTVPKIDSLKIGKEVDKDNDVTKETTTFAPKETVYGFIHESAPGKVTIKWQVIVVKSEGAPENFHYAPADANVEIGGSGTSNYHLPLAAEFPPGKYRLEVQMVDESGAEKDKKTAEFTVTAPANP